MTDGPIPSVPAGVALSNAPVTTVFGRLGQVVATAGDYTAAQVGAIATGAAAGGDLGGTLPSPAVDAMFGHGATVQPTAYTNSSGQPSSKTLAATTAAVQDATPATNVTPYGFAQAQANAITSNLNALRADVDNLQKTVGQLIADLKAIGATA